MNPQSTKNNQNQNENIFQMHTFHEIMTYSKFLSIHRGERKKIYNKYLTTS